MGSAVVEVFAASTAIALSGLECQWFAAGHSGDAYTTPVTAGGVHCPFHGQGDGTDRAECGHWDEKMALVTFGIRTPSSADRYLKAGVAEMFKQQESANEL